MASNGNDRLKSAYNQMRDSQLNCICKIVIKMLGSAGNTCGSMAVLISGTYGSSDAV
jgi:hypothetical protein